jgi:hypothetical protein
MDCILNCNIELGIRICVLLVLVICALVCLATTHSKAAQVVWSGVKVWLVVCVQFSAVLCDGEGGGVIEVLHTTCHSCSR